MATAKYSLEVYRSTDGANVEIAHTYVCMYPCMHTNVQCYLKFTIYFVALSYRIE